MRASRRCARNPFVNLRTFLEFWVDQRTQLPCCLFATDEEVQSDIEQYDCQTCAVADAIDDLWPENRAAWSLSRSLLTRFAADCHLVPVILDRLTREQDAEAFEDTVTRLGMIYDEVCPVVVSES